MILNEARFVILFVVTVVAFFLSPVRWRHGVLIASGLLFYAWYASAVLPLILGLVLLTYWVSGRVGVWLNVGALVLLMGYFKLRGGVGVLPGIVSAETGAEGLAFPLGLSFLTFELIHFSIERQRGRIPRASLASVAAFALYFPCRVAGPIKRYQPFEQSVREARWSIEHLYRGSVRILWGLVKKVMLADVVGLIVPELNWASSPLAAWKGIIAYSLYIYWDFSAYSDIAIGLSGILGIRVPENFRAPYLSRNIREFWSRWHMSLSSWLADYVFLPLSRQLAVKPWGVQPKTAAVLSYVATFTICGLWHGPSLNFVLWGLYHGALLSLYALYAVSRLSLAQFGRHNGLARVIGRVISPAATFATVTVGWVLFAVPTQRALGLLSLMMAGVYR